MQEFHRNNLPSPVDTWPQYRKVVSTHALRVEGEFSVQTSEGTLHCKDGYLCIDARGYPYPVAKEEFDLIYVLAATPAYESPPIENEVIDPQPGDVAIGSGGGLAAGPPPPALQQNQAFERKEKLVEDGDETHYE